MPSASTAITSSVHTTSSNSTPTSTTTNVAPKSVLSSAAIGGTVGGVVGGTAFFAIAILINFLVRGNQHVNRDGVENVEVTRDEGVFVPARPQLRVGGRLNDRPGGRLNDLDPDGGRLRA